MFKRVLSGMLFCALLSVTVVQARAASPVDTGSQTRSVVDMQGAEVVLPLEVNRVISLWHANNQVILLLSGADKLVGTTAVIKDLPWFAHVYPRIKEVPSYVDYESAFSTEAILQANPDVVICTRAHDAGVLRDLGLAVVVVGFSDFDGLKETVRVTAEVLGGDAPRRAQEFITYFDGNLTLLQTRLADLEESQKPKVYQIRNWDPTHTDGRFSICTRWIEAGGGINAIADVADRSQAVVTIEEILKANPDVIIASATCDADKTLEKIKADPKWADVNAVQQNKLYVNPVGTFLWNRYSCEEALQVLWVAKILHPQKFADIDMVKEVQAFYQKFYAFDLSTEEAELLLAGKAPR